MKIALLFAPLIVAGTIVAAATAAHRRIPPHLAARTTTFSLIVLLAGVVPSLASVVLTYLAHLPALGPAARWCAHTLGVHDTVPAWLGLPALGVVIVGSWRAAKVLRDHRHLRCHQAGDIEVVADHDPLAVTLPGAGGRIIVSQGLLDLLEPHETDVVLAHERAHANHRHDRLVLIAELGAAFFPPLRHVANRIRFAVERWADEAAARHCGDRRLVATTLGKVALGATQPVGVVGFASLGTVARAEALLRPLQRRPPRPAMAALWSVLAAAAVLALVQVHHLHQFVIHLHPH